MNFDIKKHLVLEVISGSKAYGTETPDSDTDYRGVFIPPLESLLGLDKIEVIESHNPDTVYYSLQRFMSLATKGNPQALEMLFNTNQLVKCELTDLLLSIKHSFVTKQAASAYLGFASSQLSRIKNRDCPVGKSESRAKDIESYGWDVKYGAHLIRLLETGLELLETGSITVRRPNREYLKDIRRGVYSKDDILLRAGELIEQVKNARDLSQLPERPSWEFINGMTCNIVKMFYNIP